jgi:hypothetical protein
MATYGAPILSDPIITKIDGKDYHTRTSTKVTQGSDGKVTGGETTILYAPISAIPIFGTTNYIPSATTKDGGKTWNYLKYKQGDEIPSGKNVGDEIFGSQTKKSLEGGALKTNTNKQIALTATRSSIPPAQQKPLTLNQNTANPTGAGTTTDNTAKVKEEDLKKEQSSARAREKYPLDLKYPETLDSKQDCIKFKILKSEPRPLGATAGISGSRSAPINRSRGSVILPISGPVSDSNRVTYGSDSLTPVEGFFADLGLAAVTGGGDAAGGVLDKGGKTVKDNPGEIKTAVANEAVKAATGVNALTRKFGLVTNPNMELLFTGPELRTFSFTFRLTPRSEKEAIIVRKIIRFFKQGMSVQRTKSQIYLSTPNSFEIEYLTGGKRHPYLPKIKECALTDCSVNYAPDGTYMTYAGDETSMTAYDLQLQFSELEPIFNDEYTELDKDSDSSIGF